MVGVDSIDLGANRQTERGNRYIVVMICYFTRWVEAIAVCDQLSITIARAVVQGIVCRHGVPHKQVSDGGHGYGSALVAHVCELMGIKHKHITPYHPEGNSVVERVNGTIKRVLTRWAHEYDDEWDLMLPYAIFSYNTSFHRSLKTSPFYAQYCRQPRLPIDIELGRACPEYADYKTYAVELGRRIHKTHKDINRLWSEHTDEQAELYTAKRASLPSYKVDSMVWLRNDGDVSKLAPKWRGPYKVLERVSDLTYKIDFNGGTLINIDRLKAYQLRTSTSVHDVEQDTQHVAQLLDSANRTAAEFARSRDEIQRRHDELQRQRAELASASATVTTTTSATTSTTHITAPTTSVHSRSTSVIRVVSPQRAVSPHRGRPSRSSTSSAQVSTAGPSLSQPTYARVMRPQKHYISYGE